MGVAVQGLQKDGSALVGSPVPVAGVDSSGNIQSLNVDTSGSITLAAGTAAIGKLAANSGVDIGDVDVISLPTYATVAVGELAGSATAVVMPTVTCKQVKFKAAYDNAGRVYIGGSGVTVKDGTTDTTTGLELSAGEETPWLPVANLNVFYRISDNAGDDLTYLALA